MIKKIILGLLFILPLLVKAQVIINTQLPQAGFVQKDQLWNLILVNNKEDILDISINMNLKDAVTGQVVLSASTANILLGKGVKVITVRDVQPVLYNYNSQDLSKTYLPMGNYTICYQVISNGPKRDPLGEECMSINIDPLSPPLLNTPADKSEVLSPYPQFTWLPPTPFDMFSNLSYDLLVTEVNAGQNAVEAMEYNTPIYIRNSLTQPYESYASSFTKLDTGKIYAWQVLAKNGLSYASKTDVWTFTVKSENKSVPSTGNSYILLNGVNKDQGIYNLQEKSLNIKYYSFDKEHIAVIKLMSADRKVLQEINQKIIYGDNFFNFKLSQAFSKGQLYIVELTAVNGNKHDALFNINK